MDVSGTPNQACAVRTFEFEFVYAKASCR
jgi:hypothetical protein